MTGWKDDNRTLEVIAGRNLAIGVNDENGKPAVTLAIDNTAYSLSSREEAETFVAGVKRAIEETFPRGGAQ